MGSGGGCSGGKTVLHIVIGVILGWIIAGVAYGVIQWRKRHASAEYIGTHDHGDEWTP